MDFMQFLARQLKLLMNLQLKAPWINLQHQNSNGLQVLRRQKKEQALHSKMSVIDKRDLRLYRALDRFQDFRNQILSRMEDDDYSPVDDDDDEDLSFLDQIS